MGAVFFIGNYKMVGQAGCFQEEATLSANFGNESA
jgi:hypothetical protein